MPLIHDIIDKYSAFLTVDLGTEITLAYADCLVKELLALSCDIVKYTILCLVRMCDYHSVVIEDETVAIAVYLYILNYLLNTAQCKVESKRVICIGKSFAYGNDDVSGLCIDVR